LAERNTVWGGCPLEPDVLLRLARHPPADDAALADVPGVGPSLAERLGRTILSALGTGGGPASSQEGGDPMLASLERWRGSVAQTMGVPDYAVIPDTVLRTISTVQPQSRLDLARIRGVGPRTLAKFGDDLLRLVAGDM
jgi:hypothetical protein